MVHDLTVMDGLAQFTATDFVAQLCSGGRSEMAKSISELITKYKESNPIQMFSMYN